MEVKVGVQYAPRELVIESEMTQDEVEKAVSDAIRSDLGVLTLVDDKGRRVIVPIDKLAYVEIAEAETRRVGFGATMCSRAGRCGAGPGSVPSSAPGSAPDASSPSSWRSLSALSWSG